MEHTKRGDATRGSDLILKTLSSGTSCGMELVRRLLLHGWLDVPFH